MKNWDRHGRIRGLLLVIVTSLALWGCVPDSPTAAIDEDAPVFIDPRPSPTPTWAAPGPDDSGQIIDCALEAPICVIDVAVVEVAGEAYLGVNLRAVPIPGKWQPDGADNVLLDVNVSVQRYGETVAEINVEGHSAAVIPAEGGIILTEEGGAPLLRIDSSELGLLLADPRRSPIAFIAYEADAGDLILLDADGDSLATIYDGDAGVLLANLRPSPSALVSSDPTEGGFLILNAEAEPLVVVDISNETVWLLDSMGDRVAGVSMLYGLVVIAAPGGGPVALVGSGTLQRSYPAFHELAEQDSSRLDSSADSAESLMEGRRDPRQGSELGLIVIVCIPLPVGIDGQVDLVGGVVLHSEGQPGTAQDRGRVTVKIKEIEIKGGQVALKPTATPAAPKPTATTAPPKPTAKPTDDGSKPSPTPGK